ncbi:MAG: hypothetical protein K2O32_01930 [Acetatifactor sp.]|nr:hypothetical protein [Acetatifactor sp.]
MKKRLLVVCVLVLMLVGCGNPAVEIMEFEEESVSGMPDNGLESVPETTDTEAAGNEDAAPTLASEGEHSMDVQPDDIVGMYVYENDGSTFSVTANADGSYGAELVLVGLTMIDDFAGAYENNTLTVTGTDAAGNPIIAEVRFSGEQAVLTFTDSTWEYLENGKQMVFVTE